MVGIKFPLLEQVLISKQIVETTVTHVGIIYSWVDQNELEIWFGI